MMRIAAMTLTGLLVVLAVIQGLVFAALPRPELLAYRY